jgi:hypothetical protein
VTSIFNLRAFTSAFESGVAASVFKFNFSAPVFESSLAASGNNGVAAPDLNLLIANFDFSLSAVRLSFGSLDFCLGFDFGLGSAPDLSSFVRVVVRLRRLI